MGSRVVLILLAGAIVVGCGEHPATAMTPPVDAGTGVIDGDPPDAGVRTDAARPRTDTGRVAGCDDDDHGDTRRGASWVADPSRTAGRINCPIDIDVFRFSANRAGTYRIATMGLQVACSLERRAGELLGTSGADACDFEVTLRLGYTYYISVEPRPDQLRPSDYTLVIGPAGEEPPSGFCGDGNVDPGEACDDGNQVDGDGCSAACRVEPARGACGDGQLDPGEACDDGNRIDGDGCSADCRVEPPQQNRPPSRPRITVVGEAVRGEEFEGIEVTLGRDPEGQQVQALCWSSGSDHSTEARAVASPLGRGGARTPVALTWSSTGRKTVYCKTRDQGGALSASDNEPVQVAAPNRRPNRPTIQVDAEAVTRQPFAFIVRLGTDPDRDRVQALCWSSSSNHSSEARGATSELVNSGREAEVNLTWNSPGSRSIRCRTRDEHGEVSSSYDTEQVRVANPNRAPSTPRIEINGAATRRQPYELRIRLGRDPDSDDVRAKCWSSGSDYRDERRAGFSIMSRGGRTVTLDITWSSTGSKTVYCVTEDEHGAVSSRARGQVRVNN